MALALVAAFALCGCSDQPPDHGIAFVLGVETNAAPNSSETAVDVANLASILRRRIDKILDGRVFIHATNAQLVVQMANIPKEKLSAVRSLLTKRGLLELCMVHTNSAEWIQGGVVPPGYRVVKEGWARDESKGTATVAWLVRTNSERGLTSQHVRRASALRNDMTREVEISFEFDDVGKKLFEEITTEYQPRGQQFFHLGILFDGVLHSAPRIAGPVSGGRAMVTGSFTPLEGQVFATLLETPLERGLRIIEERTY